MDEYLWNGRIAVGVDGSPESRTAALWAAQEASQRRCGLTLVHAVLPPVGTSPFGAGMPSGLNPMAKVRQGALTELDEIASTLTAADVQTRIEVGSPSGIIIGASETAAIVVVGSRGQGGFKRLLLGSVSTQVATHSACPVIIIRSLPDPSADTVVVGMDGTAGSSAAIGFAFDMASLHGWRLIAVHAWEVPAYDLLIVPSAGTSMPLRDSADDEARHTAEALAGFQADHPDVVVRQSLVRGSARNALLEASASAALIVVGSRRHGQVMSAVLGSVSHGVLHHAQAPVAIVSGHQSATVAR